MPLFLDKDTDAGIPKFAGLGQVVAVVLSQPGSGYTVAPTPTFAAPPASVTATATSAISGGVVTSVTMVLNGTNYITAPAVTFTAAPSGGVTATGTAIMDGHGSVVGVTITNAGSGYVSAPTPTFAAPPAPVTATGTTTINASGQVTSVVVTDPGSFYTVANPPTVTFTAAPSGGTTATGVVAFKERNSHVFTPGTAVLFLSIDQAQLTANRALGMKTPGWFSYMNYTDANGETHYRIEPLVAMSKTEAYAGKNPNNTVVTG